MPGRPNAGCVSHSEEHAEATVNAVIMSAARARLVLASPRRADLRKANVANDGL